MRRRGDTEEPDGWSQPARFSLRRRHRLTAVRVRSIHSPLIPNKTFTAHTDNKVPTVTGNNIAANAHHSITVNRDCFRASNRIMPPAKQTAGVTITASIHNKGVADQSLPKPLVE